MCACLGSGGFQAIGRALKILFMHCAAYDLEATLVVLTSLIATRVVNRRLYSALMYDWNARVRAGLGSSWVALFLLRAPFGQYGPVAAFELYLYTAVDSRPGPGGSRTTASCQP